MSRRDVTDRHRQLAEAVMAQPVRRAKLMQGLDPESFDGLEALAYTIAKALQYMSDRELAAVGLEQAIRRIQPRDFGYHARSLFGAVRDAPRKANELADDSDLHAIQKGIADLLGVSPGDLPFVDRPPEWLRMMGDMNDDATANQAALGSWLQQVGTMMTLQAGQVETVRAVAKLAEIDMEEAVIPDGLPEQIERAWPFFGEGVLYNLVGKEQARSILGRLRAVQQPLGLSS